MDIPYLSILSIYMDVLTIPFFLCSSFETYSLPYKELETVEVESDIEAIETIDCDDVSSEEMIYSDVGEDVDDVDSVELNAEGDQEDEINIRSSEKMNDYVSVFLGFWKKVRENKRKDCFFAIADAIENKKRQRHSTA